MSTQQLVSEAISKHGKSRENLLPVLQHIVKHDRYLCEDTIKEVARQMELSSADVYGTASFYSFLETYPQGKNIIRICKTIACDMKGKEDIIEAIENTLKINLGETTPDGKFSFVETNCLGWCHKGPAMLINDEPYTELTPEKAIEALNEYIGK